MSDRRPPDPREPDGPTASAWLAGDLDPEAAAAFERRLSRDPETAAELAAVHDAVVRLRRVDEVTPPDGYASRLRERLAHERQDATRAQWAGHGPAAAPPQGERAGARTPPGLAEVVPLDRKRRLSRAVLSAAAVLLLVVAGFAGIVPLLTSGRGGSAGDAEVAAPAAGGGESAASQDAAEEQAVDEGAAQEPDAQTDDGGDTLAAEPPAAPEQDERSALAGPPVAAGPPLALGADPQAALAARYSGLPEVEVLRGLPAARAQTEMEEANLALQQVPLVNGVAPGECLGAAVDGTAAAPALIDVLEVDGTPATAWVLVSASPGSATLDQVEVRVLAAYTCAELARATLP